MRKLYGLAKNEEGQGLAIACIMLVILGLSVAVVANTGNVARSKIEMQNAADAAAYSGAVVQANIHSTVAWINDGMSHIYYNLMRYAIDTNVYGVLAELEEHPSAASASNPKNLGIGRQVVGIDNAAEKYDAAYLVAQEWLGFRDERGTNNGRGNIWLQELGRIENGIALSAKYMILKEIYDVAIANGAEYVTVFPEFEYWPDPANDVSVEIEKLEDGWRLTLSNGYTLTVRKIDDNHWTLESSSGTVEINVISDDHWEITYNGTKYNVEKRGTLGWTVTSGGSAITFDPSSNDPSGWVVSSGGDSIELRGTPPSGLEKWSGGNWVPFTPADYAQLRTMGVSFATGNTFSVGPMRVSLTSPPGVTFGNTTVSFTDPIYVSVTVPNVRITINRDIVLVNGVNPEIIHDGIWHPIRGGYERYRVTELEPGTKWLYEWSKMSSYFLLMPADRFGKYTLGKYHSGPEFPEWFDENTGGYIGPRTYTQTRLCWHKGAGGCDCNECVIPEEGEDPPAGNPCTICGRQDNDGDGRSDVRKYSASAFGRNTPHYMCVFTQRYVTRTGRPPQITYNYNVQTLSAIVMTDWRAPLIISEDMFKYGLNVGVWKASGNKMASIGFSEPGWGYFAFATARAGVWDERSADYIYYFPDSASRTAWAQSEANLFEARWKPKLFPVGKTVLAEDLDAGTFEDPINYIWRGLKEGPWRRSYSGGSNRTPTNMWERMQPRNANKFNVDDRSLGNSSLH